MSYHVQNYTKLGLLHELLHVDNRQHRFPFRPKPSYLGRFQVSNCYRFGTREN